MGVATAIGAAASLAGGMMAKSASGDAADAQVRSTQQGIDEQRRQYNQTRQDLAPWRETGSQSIRTLGDLLGLNMMERPSAPSREDFYTTQAVGGGVSGSTGSYGATPWRGQINNLLATGNSMGTGIRPQQTRTFDSQGYNQAMDEYRQALDAYQGYEPSGMLLDEFGLDDFREDPGYRFRLSEGQKAIDRGAAARGGFDSGATLKALNEFSQNTAANEFQNAFNRDATYKDRVYNYLMGVGESGRNAQGTVASVGSQTAGNISNLYGQQGNAQAAGIVGGANALSGGIGRAVDMYQQDRVMNQVFGNRGGQRSPWNLSNTAQMSNWGPI